MRATLRQVWSLFLPGERRRAVVMLVLVILMAGAETLGVLSIVPFLSVLGRPEIIHENPIMQRAWQAFGFREVRDFILALGIASITIVFLSSAFKTVTLHLVNRFVHMQRHSLSARLLATYLRQPYEFFLLHNPSALAKNVLSEVDQLIFELIQPFSQLVAQGTVVLAMLLVIVLYDPLMAAGIIGAVSLLYGLIYAVARQRLARIGAERQQANAERYKACNEAIGGIKDVKITHSDAAYVEAFSRSSREYSRHTATAETISTSPLYIVEAVGYSGLILIALFLLRRSADLAHVLPALGLYGFAAYRMLPAVQIMYRGFARLRFSTAALSAISADLALPGVPGLSAPPGRIVPRKEITLRNIRFAYPSAPERPVLRGFELVIPAGTSVGIVGPSGAGKSTIMDLLLGLLRPQQGELLVDGVPITDANRATWQRSIGYVPQHIFLADASVAENIAFGAPPAEIDMEAVRRAARIAQIDEFITRDLPRGYDTPVGDRGIRLSGGQRQRLGVARALYFDPPVLFLDEATSALDEATEHDFTEALSHAAVGRTLVTIAHRRATLRGCATEVRLPTN